MTESTVSFGPFVLYPLQRQLLQNGQPVKIGSRALDLLLALVERAGEVMAHGDLLSRAWPDTLVDESSLRVHIGNLRKSLGDDPTKAVFIANVPGRGYCFVASVIRGEEARKPAPGSASGASVAGRLPIAITKPIGREETIAALELEIGRRRLTTIVGPGGIGKTTVALAAAQASAPSFRDGVVLVDLALISDPATLVTTIAAALGVPLRSQDIMSELIAQLADREILVVLDGCEHLIDAVADLVERILRATAGISVLASSREPMRAEGEWVHRLGPLDIPPEGAVLTAAEAVGYAGVELFVERASAALGGFELHDDAVPLVIEVCRRLDGIALAIELAAARAATVGLAQLARSLDDCFRLLTQGRRTALPRHQTLRATFDWSYGLLSSTEQAVFRRLGVLNGDFTLQVAEAIASCPATPKAAVDEVIANLVAKSLLTAEINSPLSAHDGVRFRLLDTARTYAREQLEASGEVDRVQRIHAEFYRSLFRRAEAEWETRPTAEWMATYVPHLANLRGALDWASGTDTRTGRPDESDVIAAGDPEIGVALTVAAVPLWFQLSLIDECIDRVQAALAHAEANDDTRSTMQLYAALGFPRLRAGIRPASGAAAWARVLDIAERINDPDYQARALWALWVDRTNHGKPRESLELAERYAAATAASGSDADVAISHRMRARSLHLLGDPAAALDAVNQMLEDYLAPANRSHLVRFQYDQRLTARITLGRVLWLLGRFDEALDEIRDNVAAAQKLDHALTLAHVLSDAGCPIALLAGDLSSAEHYLSLLRHQTKLHGFDVWDTHADAFEGEILIKRGKAAAGIKLLKAAIDRLRASNFFCIRPPSKAVWLTVSANWANRTRGCSSSIRRSIGAAATARPGFYRSWIVCAAACCAGWATRTRPRRHSSARYAWLATRDRQLGSCARP